MFWWDVFACPACFFTMPYLQCFTVDVCFKSGLYNQTQALWWTNDLYCLVFFSSRYDPYIHTAKFGTGKPAWSIYVYIYIVFWYMCVLHGVASFYIISMLHHFATEILTGALKSPFHFQTCPVWNTLMIINACLNGSPVVTSNSSLQDVFVGRKLLGGKCGILTFRNGPFQAQDSWKEDWCCRGLSDVMVGIPQSNYHGCDHF